MATEQENQPTETASAFDRFSRNRDLYLLMPFILGFSDRHTHQTQNPNSEESTQNDDNPSPSERIVLVNPFTQGMIVIESSSDLDPLLRSLLETRRSSESYPPASKASIEAMPRVEIREDGDGECVICLEDFTAGDTAKEMPCRHRFHGECIEKWLGFHGSCPVCRYKLPVDEDEMVKKRDDGEREIWVRFSFNGGRRNRDSEDQDNESALGNNDDRENNNDTDSNNGSGSSSPVLESES